MESHIVFYDSTQFASLGAAANGNKHTDLIVMAIGFKLSERDSDLFQFTTKLNQIIDAGKETEFEINNVNLLPMNIHEYYEFEGSLTTEPYHEITTWIVFPETKLISRKQVRSPWIIFFKKYLLIILFTVALFSSNS